MKQSIFRGIRRKLLNEGKLVRYLTYAIGEVVLIIVGILFALKINDWNENQKKQEEFELYIVQLKEDVREAIDYARRMASISTRGGHRNNGVIEFLERAEFQPEELASFETGLRGLGRFVEPQLGIGLLGDLLQGNNEIISRDKALYLKTLGLVRSLRSSLATIAHIHEAIDVRRTKLDPFRAANESEYPNMPFRYDLEKLRTSTEFIFVTQNIATQMVSVSNFLNRTADRLEEYLALLEEYETP